MPVAAAAKMHARSGAAEAQRSAAAAAEQAAEKFVTIRYWISSPFIIKIILDNPDIPNVI